MIFPPFYRRMEVCTANYASEWLARLFMKDIFSKRFLYVNKLDLGFGEVMNWAAISQIEISFII